MILISLILMYYSHACRENLWKWAGFWVGCFVCFMEFHVYEVCISFREILCTEKQRAKIPEITGDIGVMSYFDLRPESVV